MGEVYRALDTRLERNVAIKVLPAAFAADPERLNRFTHEARLLSSLNHPNLLAIYDVGAQDGIHYLVSELLDGATLRQRLQEGSVPPRKALDYAVQTAKGLAAAHDKGIVHRDLKPENLFITTDSRIKILDFGLAKQNLACESEEGATLTSPGTAAGMVLGTVGYMSPEQVRGNPADPRSDIFSFGAILYEMLSGVRAFRGESSVETMSAILKEDPPEISATSKKVSPAAERLIRRCLEKAPEERFQSARDLAFALEALSGSSASDALTAVAQRSETRSSLEHNWRLWLALAAALLIALVAVTALRHPTPVAEFVQLTNDTNVKNVFGWPPPVLDSPLASDGSRLYFTVSLGAGATPAQVSTQGGELAPLHISLPYSGFELMGISPDGSELLVESWVGSEVEGAQWIVPVLGGPPRRLDDLTAHDEAWSPDKQLVAFAAADGLFLLDSGNAKRKIFTSTGTVLWPRWSPDGKRLRFTLEDPSTLSSALWEIQADGTGAHPLLPGWHKPAIECCGEWTGDGRYYVFQTGDFAHSDVWAVGDGLFRSSKPFQLTSGPLSFTSPLPSRDGQWLYLVGVQRRSELSRLDLTSGLATALPAMPSLDSIDYSCDGKWMAYVTQPDGTLWRSRTDGSDRLQLTYAPTRADSPKWSPDGTRIALSNNRIGQPMQIEVISAEGGTPEVIFPETRNQGSPTWSADGQSIIFGRLPWLEGGKKIPVFLEKLDVRTHQLSEILGSEDMLAPSISPDGQFLAAVHTVATQMAIYDFGTAKWSLLDQATGNRPAWARDSSAVYFITRQGQLYRYHAAPRRLEFVVTIARFLTFGASGAALNGPGFLTVGPDDSPLLVRDQRSSQLYALKWQAP
jgi:serine/threonine protein kinase